MVDTELEIEITMDEELNEESQLPRERLLRLAKDNLRAAQVLLEEVSSFEPSSRCALHGAEILAHSAGGALRLASELASAPKPQSQSPSASNRASRRTETQSYARCRHAFTD